MGGFSSPVLENGPLLCVQRCTGVTVHKDHSRKPDYLLALTLVNMLCI
jgi:hypothetical protein